MSNNFSKNVSCIIPVFNCEKYLYECLDSLLAQNYLNFEIICVDDASTDESLSILLKYCDKDKRVRVYKNDRNMGAALTRNKGLMLAEGEYVIFLDGDDIFDSHLISIAYQFCKNHDTDIGVYYHSDFYGDYIYKSNKINNYTEQKLIKNYPMIENPLDFEFLFQTIQSHAWNKIIRKSLLIENNIKFQDIPNGNDYFFSHIAVLHAKSIIFIDEVLVNYRRGHDNNLSNQRNNVMNCLPEAMDAVYEYIKKMNVPLKLYRGFINKIVSDIDTFIVSLSEEVQISIMNKFKNSLFKKWGLDKLNKSFFYTDDSYFMVKAILEELEIRTDRIYRENITKLSFLFDNMRFMRKKIVLWGAGKRSEEFLMIIQANNLDVDYIVDNNMNKQNQHFFGHLIQDYESLQNLDSVILVLHQRWIEEIKYQVGKEREIIDIRLLLSDEEISL